MRIVHAVTNVAGVPAMLAATQRQLGYQATAVLYSREGDPASGTVHLDRLLAGPPMIRKLRRAQLLAHLITTYDVFHFHYLGSFLRYYADLALLKALGKTIIFHLHGCDIRDPRRVRVEHMVSACAECRAPCLTPAKRALPFALRQYVDAVIVATPDLLEFVPGAHYIPNPLDVASWRALATGDAVGSVRSADWIVVHAPTDRAIKGTRHIEAAVARLRAEGLPVRLRLLEGLSREELRRACLDADLAVDQVLIGWFGLFALEMMALGKPVVAYIRPDLQPYLPELPLAVAAPPALADVLRDLLQSAERRRDQAARGLRYVQAEHDPVVITRRILQLYEHHRSAAGTLSGVQGTGAGA